MARTPSDRVKNQKQEIAQLRRTYSKNTNKRRKLIGPEEKYALTMVCVLRLAGYNKTQIAQALGISKAQIKEIYESPAFIEEFTVLSEKIPEAALDLLQSLMIESVMTIADVMRTDTDGKIRITAAESILDRGGAPKLSRQEKTVKNTDETVITDGGLIEKLRAAPVEVQEEAAQIIERLEDLLRGAASSNSTSEVESEVDES